MDIGFLKNTLLGHTVDKPISGTLSGHAAGEPFDKHVQNELIKQYPNNTYRQYEYLNELFTTNPQAQTYEQRANLLQSKVAKLLLLRGKSAVENWATNNIFEEKQNDTADILLIDNFPTTKFNIVDVKTTNIIKNGQPPNIISAEKLAKACSLMIDNNDYETIDINYVGIYWDLETINGKEKLVCKEAYVKSLFKAPPQQLYINWVAAQQIQFKVDDLEQSFDSTRKNWCTQYIQHFVKSCKEYTDKKLQKIKPFEQYI